MKTQNKYQEYLQAKELVKEWEENRNNINAYRKRRKYLYHTILSPLELIWLRRIELHNLQYMSDKSEIILILINMLKQDLLKLRINYKKNKA